MMICKQNAHKIDLIKINFMSVGVNKIQISNKKEYIKNNLKDLHTFHQYEYLNVNDNQL